MEDLPEVWRGSIEKSPDKCNTERKVVSQPTMSSSKPTKRYLRENGLQSKEYESAEDNKGLVYAQGLLAPTRNGSYAITKQIEVQKGLSRATSHQGIVELLQENPEDRLDNNKHDSQSTNISDAGLGITAPPNNLAQYTPSIYEGIWENNASVVSL